MDIMILTVIIYIAGAIIWLGLATLFIAFIIGGFELTDYFWRKETHYDEKPRE